MKITRRLMSGFVALSALLCFSTAHASDDTVCSTNDPGRGYDQKIVYVNGIQATKPDALEALERMTKILCTGADNRPGSPNHPGNTQKNFAFGLAYNYIGFNGVEGGEWDLNQDEKELFEQKTAEELYVGSLWKLQSYHFAPKSDIDRSAAADVAHYANNPIPGDIPPLVNGACQPWATPTATYTPHISQGSNSVSFNCDVTVDNMAKSVSTIDELVHYMLTEKSVVIVAHSQGNLLANLAYAQTATMDKPGQPGTKSEPHKNVRVVNIANTTQVSLNNLDLTHLDDNVLFGNTTYSGLVTLPANGFMSDTRGTHWYRYTDDAYGWSDRNFILDEAPFVNAQTTCSLAACKHFMMDTYLSTDMVTVKSSSLRGVQYTAQTQQFRDFFEDLVYTAAISLDGTVPGNTFAYQGSYQPIIQNFIDTDFTSLNNIQVWGSGHYDNSVSGLYGMLLPGDAGINIGLPPNVKRVQLTAHMMFMKTSEDPFQNGFGFFGNNGPYDALYVDIPSNAGICNSDGQHVLLMGGASGGWACGATTGVTSTYFMNAGWMDVSMDFDMNSCNFSMSFTYPNGAVSSASGVLSAQQCTTRSGLMINTGAPNNNAYLLINHLKVVTTQ